VQGGPTPRAVASMRRSPISISTPPRSSGSSVICSSTGVPARLVISSVSRCWRSASTGGRCARVRPASPCLGRAQHEPVDRPTKSRVRPPVTVKSTRPSVAAAPCLEKGVAEAVRAATGSSRSVRPPAGPGWLRRCGRSERARLRSLRAGPREPLEDRRGIAPTRWRAAAWPREGSSSTRCSACSRARCASQLMAAARPAHGDERGVPTSRRAGAETSVPTGRR